MLAKADDGTFAIAIEWPVPVCKGRLNVRAIVRPNDSSWPRGAVR